MEDFWYGVEMEWKKISSIEYGKIVFHSIPYHALQPASTQNLVVVGKKMYIFSVLFRALTKPVDLVLTCNWKYRPVR